MAKALLHFLMTAAVFFLMGQRLPGFYVDGWTTAILSALALGAVNVTVGPVLKLLALPLTILTLGLFSFVVNAALITLVAFFIPGFSIHGFWPALVAAVILSGVNLLWKMATAKPKSEEE